MAHNTPRDAEQAERERVGATLRAIREIRGWKLGEFAAQIGISHGYLANIEAGRRPLTDQLLAKAAAELGVEQKAITHPRTKAGEAA